MDITDKIFIGFGAIMVLFCIYKVFTRIYRPYDIEQCIINGKYETSVYYMWGNFNGKRIWRITDEDDNKLEDRLIQAYREIEKHKKLEERDVITKKTCK